MGAFAEPVSRSDQARLRRLVLDHRAAERRRRFPAAFHVGVPGRPGLQRIGDVGDDLDHALRCDVLEAVLRRSPEATSCWLTRPGDLADQDIDLAWLRAVRAVSGETGVPLTYVVVCREGWRDPRSGVGRTWRRLRETR